MTEEIMKRTVERIGEDGKFHLCDFEELKSGDFFRAFEPNGEPVYYYGDKTKTQMVVTSKPYKTDVEGDGSRMVWTVDVLTPEEYEEWNE